MDDDQPCGVAVVHGALSAAFTFPLRILPTAFFAAVTALRSLPSITNAHAETSVQASRQREKAIYQ